MKAHARRSITLGVGLAMLASQVSASTLPPEVDPPTGDLFPVYDIDMAALGLSGHYAWSEDIAGLSVGDTLFELRVDVTAGFQYLQTFQVYGNCDGVSEQLAAQFSLEIDGTDTPWTITQEDPCDYHDYVDVMLPIGDISMKLIYDGIRPGGSPIGPNGTLVGASFGNIMTAIPLPPAIFGLGAALAGLGAVRRRSKTPA